MGAQRYGRFQRNSTLMLTNTSIWNTYKFSRNLKKSKFEYFTFKKSAITFAQGFTSVCIPAFTNNHAQTQVYETHKHNHESDLNKRHFNESIHHLLFISADYSAKVFCFSCDMQYRSYFIFSYYHVVCYMQRTLYQTMTRIAGMDLSWHINGYM